MPGDFDKSLLESPYAKQSDGSSKRVWITGAAMVVALAVAVGIFLVLSDGPTQDVANVSTTTSGELSAVPAVVDLVPTNEDPQLLIHPTVLPDGWQACDVTEDYGSADRFCGSDESLWVSVKFVSPESFRPPDTTPTGVLGGEWVNDSEPVEIHFPINGHYTAIVQSQGLDREQTLEVATSIPIVGQRQSLIGSYEIPIEGRDVTEDDIAALFATISDDPDVELGRYEFRVRSPLATLYAFRTSALWTDDAATDFPYPRMLPADRPLVVGESVDRNKAFAVWDQGGFAWSLEGSLDADQVSALALDIVTKVADYPRVDP